MKSADDLFMFETFLMRRNWLSAPLTQTHPSPQSNPKVAQDTACGQYKHSLSSLAVFKGQSSLAAHHHFLLEPGQVPRHVGPDHRRSAWGYRRVGKLKLSMGGDSRHPRGPEKSSENRIIKDAHRCLTCSQNVIDWSPNPPGMTMGILTGHRSAPSVPGNQRHAFRVENGA